MCLGIIGTIVSNVKICLVIFSSINNNNKMLTNWIKHVIDDLINMIYSDNNDKQLNIMKQCQLNVHFSYCKLLRRSVGPNELDYELV